MRDAPNLPIAQLSATLTAQYGLRIQSLTFLPIGNDSATFVYEAVADNGMRYFVKLRSATGFGAPSILVPRALHEQGVANIVVPLKTASGALWVQLGAFALVVYPFIDARTASAAGLSDAQWFALGNALRKIHACALPAEIQRTLAREAFVPSRRNVLSALEAVIARQDLSDPAQLSLQAFWHEHQAEIRALIAHTDALGAALRLTALEAQLCHADIHTWNILVDDAQRLWIVDWDEVMLAPKERDLMFMIGGIARDLVTPQQTAHFLAGYGPAEIDARALTYYRHAWALQDMAANAEDVFFAPERSQEARSDTAHAFISLFAPGQIVSIAHASQD